MRAVVLGAAALFASSVSASAVKPTGEWAVPGNVAHLHIADCDGRLWGVVSWERRPSADSHNPDPAKRSRPMLGVPILLGMKRAQPNRWDGEIYNANNGKIYTADIRLTGANVLHVEGCFLGFLCGGQDWTRIKPTTVRYDPLQADPSPIDASVTRRMICSSVRREERNP